MNPFVFRIRDLEAHKKGLDIDLPLSRAFLLDALADTSADAGRSAARLVAHLNHYTGGNVSVRGSLSGQLEASCQRCLGPATVPVDVKLNMTFVPAETALPTQGEEIADPFDPDDIDYAHHDHESLDLAEVVREHLLLSLPITILCRDECQGLCPVCGVDKNTTTCACEMNVSLSPFAALKKLKV